MKLAIVSSLSILTASTAVLAAANCQSSSSPLFLAAAFCSVFITFVAAVRL